MCSWKIEKLFDGALVKWFGLCLKHPDSLTTYTDIVDGILLHEVFSQIDPELPFNNVVMVNGNSNARLSNLEATWRNIRCFYEEELRSVIIKVPDIVKLAEEPDSHVEEMKLLLTLLLGCAVQCANKETFITQIKTMELNAQREVMEYIQQITNQSDIVISTEQVNSMDKHDLFKLIKNLIEERNNYREACRNLASNYSLDRSDFSSIIGGARGSLSTDFDFCSLSRRESYDYQPDLNNSNWQVWTLSQEQEKLKEALIECMKELCETKLSLEELKAENQQYVEEIKAAKRCKDNLDTTLEMMAHAELLEKQVTKYKKKLQEMETHKMRAIEIHGDNRLLQENREILQEELRTWKVKAERALELEAENAQLKEFFESKWFDQSQNAEDRTEKFDQVYRSSPTWKPNEIELSKSGVHTDDCVPSMQNLSEKIGNYAQTQILQLELENNQLRAAINFTNDTEKSYSRFLRLQNKMKQLSLKNEKLIFENEKLWCQNKELEMVSRQALVEIENLIPEVTKFRNYYFESKRRLSVKTCNYETLNAKYKEVKKSYVRIIREKAVWMDLLLNSKKVICKFKQLRQIMKNNSMKKLNDSSDSPSATINYKWLRSRTVYYENDAETTSPKKHHAIHKANKELINNIHTRTPIYKIDIEVHKDIGVIDIGVLHKDTLSYSFTDFTFMYLFYALS